MSLSCIKKKMKIKTGPTIPTLYTKAPSPSYKLSELHGVYVKDLKQIPDSLPDHDPHTIHKILFSKMKIKTGPTIPTLYTKAPSPSYKLSELHGVYVKDLKQIPDNLPPPRPSNTKKSEILDVSEYMLVDDKAIRVPMTILSKPVEGLVEYLVHGYEDDMSKVRVLYRWLTNQPIHRMQSLEHEPKDSQSALYHLWLLRTKRQRYSNVFSTLCRYAGLYCVIIHGATKGIHYQIGERVDMDKHYGEWNAVCINGTWRLVDTLWGACDRKDPGDGRGRFQCDESFFLPDPKDIIYTHFADSPRWQLLDSPRHLESFQETACLKNRYFELEMQILSHPLCEIECQDGEIEIMFGLQPKQSPEYTFNCYISHFDRPETKRYLTKGSNSSVPVFIHRPTESSISIRVRFPEQGIFRVEIVGKSNSKNSVLKNYDWVAIYKVIVENYADRGFPKMDPIGWGPGQEITKIGLTPFNYTSGIIVAKNIQTKVRFKIVDTNSVQNMKFYFKMASTYDNDYSVNTITDKFEVDLNILTFYIECPPFGEYTLKMYARNVRGNVTSEQRRERNICNYLLISDMPGRDTPLAVVTEKTEIFEEPDIKGKFPTDPGPMPVISSPTKVPAESVISASNVMMDSNSHGTDSIRDTPTTAILDEPPSIIHEEQTQAIKGYPIKEQRQPVVPLLDLSSSRSESPKQQEESDSGRKGPPKDPPAQSFVRVGDSIEEIPEIPLTEVPVVKKNETKNSSNQNVGLKVVSSDKVVSLKEMQGGNDDSIMLVPDKPKRPGTGVQGKRTRNRSDTKFYTALAHVRGEV